MLARMNLDFRMLAYFLIFAIHSTPIPIILPFPFYLKQEIKKKKIKQSEKRLPNKNTDCIYCAIKSTLLCKIEQPGL